MAPARRRGPCARPSPPGRAGVPTGPRGAPGAPGSPPSRPEATPWSSPRAGPLAPGRCWRAPSPAGRQLGHRDVSRAGHRLVVPVLKLALDRLEPVEFLVIVEQQPPAG